MDAYSANVFVRYISAYDDDQNCADASPIAGGCGSAGLKEIEAHTTFDAQLNIDLGSLLNTDTNYIVTVGGINLTDENPPQVFTNSGFDSKVHDPRGRQLYVRFAAEF
jgi:outer membrane receptor protein involved in Fe transport